MFLTFERLSTCNEAERHRELKCPRCEQWPELVKLEPNAGRLFECRCGVQIRDREFENNFQVREHTRSKEKFHAARVFPDFNV